ncbi:hypothetical protein E2C01_017122 [Portunus trituberculatus]|uniref:Uncharacterized protein n=1 Tax=Portunus trituberculatus TaxID=210409 RepID=A0A5B7DR22_PORTR|nr:hypothetical protein [Portunus trituberculatus]
MIRKNEGELEEGTKEEVEEEENDEEEEEEAALPLSQPPSLSAFLPSPSLHTGFQSLSRLALLSPNPAIQGLVFSHPLHPQESRQRESQQPSSATLPTSILGISAAVHQSRKIVVVAASWVLMGGRRGDVGMRQVRQDGSGGEWSFHILESHRPFWSKDNRVAPLAGCIRRQHVPGRKLTRWWQSWRLKAVSVAKTMQLS